MNLPQVDLTTFLRNLYQGLLFLVLVYLLPNTRDAAWVRHVFRGNPWLALVVVVVVGVGFSAFYRAVLWRHGIRRLEHLLGGVAQWEFHRKIVSEEARPRHSDEWKKKCVSPFVADACCALVKERLDEREAAGLRNVNSLVHALFQTSVLCLVFFLVVWLRYEERDWWSLVFSIFFLGAGIVMDHCEADLKEMVVLRIHETEYRRIVST